MPARRRHAPAPLLKASPSSPGPSSPAAAATAPAPPPPPPPPPPSPPPVRSPPVRPILRKKKSVTFHPSTRIPPSQQTTPKLPAGTWTTDPVDDSTIHPKNGPTPYRPPKLLDYSHLPVWRRDNAHILSSYRPQTYTHLSSLPSLFYAHNESCNIWSHLLGLLLFLVLAATTLLDTLPVHYPSHTAADAAALVAFFAGVCACLASSALFHLFKEVGPAEARAWNGVDYAGIVACIWGSFVASLHFGFGEGDGDGDGNGPDDGSRGVRRAYEVMISVLGAACVAVSLAKRFRRPEWRAVRAGVFVAMGLSAVLPVGHGLLLHGREELERRMGLGWVLRQAVLYLAGAGLYAARVPERWAAGYFDLVGSSHQIFHVLVVFAALAQFNGLMLAMDYKHGTPAHPHHRSWTTGLWASDPS